MDLQDEYVKAIAEKLARMNAYEKKIDIANRKNIEQIDSLVDLVNTILHKHGIQESIDKSHIRFNADYIGNITNIDDKKLSELIFEKIFPAPTRATFSHYTKFDKGQAIIENEELWLFNLLQNFKDEEFKLFYQEHNIDGYEQESEVFGVRTGYRPLMSDIFALCLTTEENQSPTLWNYFADQGTGLKLTFEIVNHIPDFREVYYSNIQTKQPIKLLKDLFTQIKDQFNYTFNFTYISKIGAFYIKACFENEAEYRFLVKLNSDNYTTYGVQPQLFQNDISYIVLPFNNAFATFKLAKVEKGPNCAKTDFDKLLPLIIKKHPGVQIIE